MAFVRYKTVKGRKYYQYVRNYREGGRHKQEVLCHLGRYRSLEDAIAGSHYSMMFGLSDVAFWEEEADSTKGYLLEFYGDELGGEVPSRAEARARLQLFEEERDDNLFEYRDGFFRVPQGWVTQEWEAERARWEARRRVEEELHDLIHNYHNRKQRIEKARQWAERHRAERDKFTAVKQKYS
jgi:hypothetical protein